MNALIARRATANLPRGQPLSLRQRWAVLLHPRRTALSEIARNDLLHVGTFELSQINP